MARPATKSAMQRVTGKSGLKGTKKKEQLLVQIDSIYESLKRRFEADSQLA